MARRIYFSCEDNEIYKTWVNDNVSYSEFERLYIASYRLINMFWLNFSNLLYEEAEGKNALTVKGVKEFDKFITSTYCNLFAVKSENFKSSYKKSNKFRQSAMRCSEDAFYYAIIRFLVYIFINYKFDDGLEDTISLTDLWTGGLKSKDVIIINIKYDAFIEKQEGIKEGLKFEQEHQELFNKCYVGKQCI